MTFKLKIEGDTLEIVASGVRNSDRDRIDSIEKALIDTYHFHVQEPWQLKPDGWMVWFHRGSSDYDAYTKTRNILQHFGLVA